MRLIDAGALLENFRKKRTPQEGADSTNQRHRYMQFLADCEAIRNAPTIDAVPVIRCKDCRHYWQEYGLCARLTDDNVCRVHVHQDDYRSFAERKEE